MHVARRIDLNALLKWLNNFPVLRLSDPSPNGLDERIAREDLRSRGVPLRGDKATIAELLRYEVESKKEMFRRLDAAQDQVLSERVNGRPSRHFALRDMNVRTMMVRA
jgi:hypothetical protein